MQELSLALSLDLGPLLGRDDHDERDGGIFSPGSFWFHGINKRGSDAVHVLALDASSPERVLKVDLAASEIPDIPF